MEVNEANSRFKVYKAFSAFWILMTAQRGVKIDIINLFYREVETW